MVEFEVGEMEELEWKHGALTYKAEKLSTNRFDFIFRIGFKLLLNRQMDV